MRLGVLILAYHVVGDVAREHDPHNLAVTEAAFTRAGRGAQARVATRS